MTNSIPKIAQRFENPYISPSSDILRRGMRSAKKDVGDLELMLWGSGPPRHDSEMTGDWVDDMPQFFETDHQI